jgi:GDPmannose 4,6-dehydratase
MPRRALITGLGGQDGSFLAELLLAEGYEVAGVVRDAKRRYENLAAIEDRVRLLGADLLDQSALTAEFAAVGATAMLEAIHLTCPETRFYQASSSEIFGSPRETPQSERTPLSPVTPYGVAKAYAHFIVGSYRLRYGLFACSGILYNHESPRRPLEFVTRKIANGAASIALGLSDELVLGDLDARRDWGYAGDYVRAMWLMLQRDEPDDYVVASGTGRSVRELVTAAFARVGLDWEQHVRVDETLKRGTAELHDLVGDPSKAVSQLGWRPTVGFEGLVHMLVDAELERLNPARSAAAGSLRG